MEQRQTGEPLGGTIRLVLTRPARTLLFASLLFANEAMAGLGPSGTRGSMVEVKAAVSTPATVGSPSALKGRLRRPGKGALFGGEV
jgi:hypothetical protein